MPLGAPLPQVDNWVSVDWKPKKDEWRALKDAGKGRWKITGKDQAGKDVFVWQVPAMVEPVEQITKIFNDEAVPF
jgi:hypothetical protein